MEGGQLHRLRLKSIYKSAESRIARQVSSQVFQSRGAAKADESWVHQLQFQLNVNEESAKYTKLIQQSKVGIGKGPKPTLVYRLESRPLTDPRPRILGLDLDLTQNQA